MLRQQPSYYQPQPQSQQRSGHQNISSPSLSRSPSQPLLEKIHHQIKRVDDNNRELLRIVDKIKSTSPMHNTGSHGHVVDRIENDIRMALNELIQNIMQFFKDIDRKLKDIGVLVSQEIQGKKMPQRIPDQPSRQEESNHKFDFLAAKINTLQVSLMETQQNEKKLINIIQSLMEKYDVNEQPTVVRENSMLQREFKKMSGVNNGVPTPKPVNPVSNLAPREEQNTRRNKPVEQNFAHKNQSIYHNLYPIEESIVKESANYEQFRLRQIEEDPSEQVYIRKLYAKNQPVYSNDIKKSLRTEQRTMTMPNAKQDQSTASHGSYGDDKQHRLNFLMEKLHF